GLLSKPRVLTTDEQTGRTQLRAQYAHVIPFFTPYEAQSDSYGAGRLTDAPRLRGAAEIARPRAACRRPAPSPPAARPRHQPDSCHRSFPAQRAGPDQPARRYLQSFQSELPPLSYARTI